MWSSSCRKEEENVHWHSESDFPELTLLMRGRSKDLYDLGETLLLVARDGVTGGAEIPGKGRVANQLSAYWFQRLKEYVPNHFLSADPADFPAPCQAYAGQLAGRSMLVKKAAPLPVRCDVRGYLTGASWQDYRQSGALGGIRLPAGMAESQRLPAPFFLPCVAGAPSGGEFSTLEEACGQQLAETLRSASLRLFFKAWKIARYRGLLLVEASFEFGIHEGAVVLIDECLTPETSRFWTQDGHRTGRVEALSGEFLSDTFVGR